MSYIVGGTRTGGTSRAGPFMSRSSEWVRPVSHAHIRNELVPVSSVYLICRAGKPGRYKIVAGTPARSPLVGRESAQGYAPGRATWMAAYSGGWLRGWAWVGVWRPGGPVLAYYLSA